MQLKYPTPIDDSFFLDILLSLLSSLRPSFKKLSPTELLLLKEFILLPPKFEYSRFSIQARKIVRETLASKGWKTSKPNFNNKVTSLLNKGYIFRDDDDLLMVSPSIMSLYKTWLKDNSFEVILKLTREIQSKN